MFFPLSYSGGFHGFPIAMFSGVFSWWLFSEARWHWSRRPSALWRLAGSWIYHTYPGHRGLLQDSGGATPSKTMLFFRIVGDYTTLIIIHLGTRSTILVLFLGGFLKMRDPSFSLTLAMFAGGTHWCWGTTPFRNSLIFGLPCPDIHASMDGLLGCVGLWRLETHPGTRLYPGRLLAGGCLCGWCLFQGCAGAEAWLQMDCSFGALTIQFQGHSIFSWGD